MIFQKLFQKSPLLLHLDERWQQFLPIFVQNLPDLRGTTYAVACPDQGFKHM